MSVFKAAVQLIAYISAPKVGTILLSSILPHFHEKRMATANIDFVQIFCDNYLASSAFVLLWVEGMLRQEHLRLREESALLEHHTSHEYRLPDLWKKMGRVRHR